MACIMYIVLSIQNYKVCIYRMTGQHIRHERWPLMILESEPPMKVDFHFCHFTFPLSVIWTDFFLWRTSCPFCGVAPLRCLLKVSRALYPNCAACPRIGYAIWPSCPGPSVVPVLRRSGLFQENSVTKRVSMPVLEQASLRWLIRTAPTTLLHPPLSKNNSMKQNKTCVHTLLLPGIFRHPF